MYKYLHKLRVKTRHNRSDRKVISQENDQLDSLLNRIKYLNFFQLFPNFRFDLGFVDKSLGRRKSRNFYFT